MPSYTIKRIVLDITLAKGSFGGGGNRKIISDLATDVTIEKNGLPDKNTAYVQVANVNIDDIQQITTLGFRSEKLKNLIDIRAGDDETGLSLIYSGEIVSAFGDFNTEPDPSLRIEAQSGGYPSLIAEPPRSYKGSIPVADVIGGIAQSIGYGFVNEGVTASLRNPVFNGSPIQKARLAAKQAGVTLLIDDGVMTLTQAGKPRSGNAVLLADNSGMLGYPTFNDEGIVARCLFNPALRLGGLVRVESIVPKARGTWRVTKLIHDLSAGGADAGPWETTVEAAWVQD